MNSHIAYEMAKARGDELRSRAAVHRRDLETETAPARAARALSRIRLSRERRRAAARTPARGEVFQLTASSYRLADGSWLHAHRSA
jgi:hypothetical protein